MKRRQLLKQLEKHGCELFREGSRPSIYWNPESHLTSTVPRHSEILDQLARKICKDLGIPKI